MGSAVVLEERWPVLGRLERAAEWPDRVQAVPRHGWMTHPRSRADIECNGGWPSSGLEAGKFFPATQVVDANFVQ